MNFRRHKKNVNLIRLPIAALIDVVLFLLMYFIMAGTLRPVEGELPATVSTQKSGAGKGSALSSQVVRIEMVNGSPRFRIGQRVFENQAALTEVLSKLPKEPGVVVQAAPDAPIDATAAALQAAKSAGFVRVSYVASN